MFDFLKGSRPKDVKAIRSAILQFIKEQLQKAEGGEGANIKGLLLYLTCSDELRHLYEAAVYVDEPDRFKDEEIQKIADDFAIALPAGWTLETSVTTEIPPEAIVAKTVDAALFISTKNKPVIVKKATAYIRVLFGEADKGWYTISSSSGKTNIGREKRVQTADGFMRENIIAFPDKSSNAANRSVSRQHAHIEWDAVANAFVLFADEGGVPPQNKIKVLTADETPVKLQTTEIGHQLNEGDQILLGEAALLLFTLKVPG